MIETNRLNKYLFNERNVYLLNDVIFGFLKFFNNLESYVLSPFYLVKLVGQGGHWAKMALMVWWSA